MPIARGPAPRVRPTPSRVKPLVPTHSVSAMTTVPSHEGIIIGASSSVPSFCENASSVPEAVSVQMRRSPTDSKPSHPFTVAVLGMIASTLPAGETLNRARASSADNP